MKDSGIAWIGEIPKEWEASKLGTLYTNRNEKVSDKDFPPLSVTMKGILPQLETAAKTDDGDNRKLVRKGDFAINSRSDRRGSCGISPYDGSVSLINTILCPRDEMNPSFYNWLFHTSLFADEFYKWGHGIVDDLWTTRWQEMKNIYVVVPNLKEQQSIANFLDEKCSEIDELISLQEKMIDELKSYKQSVITEAVTKGLDRNVKMKDSGVDWIGEIPEHWNCIKLGMLFYFLGGYAFDSNQFEDETEHQVVRIGNVKNDNLLLDKSPVFVNQDVAYKAQDFKLKLNHIVFTMTGTKGKRDYFFTLLVKEKDISNKNLYINQRVGCMIVKRDIIPNFFNHLLKSSLILDNIFLYETGTVNQGNLGISSISNTIVQYPPKNEQKKIADYLDTKCSEIDTLISIKQKKIEELKEYKKSLIYEYVTGKKHVI